jgi:hypothetical protein
LWLNDGSCADDAFKLFSIANLSGRSADLVPDFDNPPAEVTRVFGPGGLRRLQLAKRISPLARGPLENTELRVQDQALGFHYVADGSFFYLVASRLNAQGRLTNNYVNLEV